MTISMLAASSLIGSAVYGMRFLREFRRQRFESRMCRAVRMAMLS